MEGEHVTRSSEECVVAKFVTIGYGDDVGYDRTAPAVRDAAHAHDDRLRERGVEMGIAGPAVQVRNHDAAEVTTEDGPFMSASRMPTCHPCACIATASCSVSVLLPTPPLPEPTARRCRTRTEHAFERPSRSADEQL